MIRSEPGPKRTSSTSCQDIEETTARNFTTKAVLRSLAGRASHVATLFRVWRPLSLKALGGHSLGEPDAPTSERVGEMFEAPTRWLTTFRRGKSGTFKRTFDPEAYQNRGERLYRWRRASSSTAPGHSRRPT